MAWWLRRFRFPAPGSPVLSAWLAALVGGLAGFAVGWVLASAMRRSQFFTAASQPLLVSIALIAVWVVIGAISGITVLAPEEEA